MKISEIMKPIIQCPVTVLDITESEFKRIKNKEAVLVLTTGIMEYIDYLYNKGVTIFYYMTGLKEWNTLSLDSLEMLNKTVNKIDLEETDYDYEKPLYLTGMITERTSRKIKKCSRFNVIDLNEKPEEELTQSDLEGKQVSGVFLTIEQLKYIKSYVAFNTETESEELYRLINLKISVN